MKILLIQPPLAIHKSEKKTCHPPMGLTYLAASIKKNYDVAILDTVVEGFKNETKISSNNICYGLDSNTIYSKITDLAPDVVGVSCLFSSQIESAQKVCSTVKKANPRIVTVMGGAHPSSVPEEVLSNQNVDYVVLGEGEIAFMNLLNYISTGNAEYLGNGQGWKDNDKIIVSYQKKFINNLDEIPFPAWDLLPLNKYFSIGLPHGTRLQNKRFLPVITSRGCPFECCFCSIHNIWGRNYRKRSVQNIISEMEWLKEKFNIQVILFEDDNLTLDKKRATTLFEEMVKEDFDFRWLTPNGLYVDSLDEMLLRTMKKSGCQGISIGIESGDPYILKNVIRKKIDLDRTPEIVKAAKKLDLETSVFFVVGLPEEGKKELTNTFKFGRKILADYTNFFFATPLPGTELLNRCKENNLITEPLDYQNLRESQVCFNNKKISKRLLKLYITREKIILILLQLIFRPRILFVKMKRRYFNQLSAEG